MCSRSDVIFTWPTDRAFYIRNTFRFEIRSKYVYWHFFAIQKRGQTFFKALALQKRSVGFVVWKAGPRGCLEVLKWTPCSNIYIDGWKLIQQNQTAAKPMPKFFFLSLSFSPLLFLLFLPKLQHSFKLFQAYETTSFSSSGLFSLFLRSFAT